MKSIEILGSGCAKCKQLHANAEAAVKELGIEAQITKVTDLREIMKRGVMSTPGLVVDGKLLSTGKLLTTAQLRDMLG